LKKKSKENSTKLKINILGKLGQALDIVGEPLMSGYLGGVFIISKSKMGGDIEF
jgi:hypothetical protein